MATLGVHTVRVSPRPKAESEEDLLRLHHHDMHCTLQSSCLVLCPTVSCIAVFEVETRALKQTFEVGRCSERMETGEAMCSCTRVNIIIPR